jgi:hypothetical protein
MAKLTMPTEAATALSERDCVVSLCVASDVDWQHVAAIKGREL